MTASNYKSLIENLVAAKGVETGESDPSVAFETLVNELTTDRFDLSFDEIEAAVTEASLDGQVDAFFILINGSAINALDDLDIPDKGPLDIRFIVVQSKYTDGFAETPLKIIRSTVVDLLDLDKNYKKSLESYNERVQERFAIARKILVATVGRSARIRVDVVYACKASTKNIHKTVKIAAAALKSELGTRFSTPEIELKFLGSEELINLSRKPKIAERILQVEKSIQSDDGESIICLSTVASLVDFASDSGEVIQALFDANVRDFVGMGEVNSEIRKTLTEIKDQDFWWLNNGVTIVCTKPEQKGRRISLSEPLIVNGLQTTNVLATFLADYGVDEKQKELVKRKLVLVKIVAPPTLEIRDEIVKATNRQTNIPRPYLRGMDLVHRNIEDKLKSDGLFYERRKNQYKNAGKKANEIVSLVELSQSLMSVLLFRGSDARARPDSLLKADDDYESLFSDKYSLILFRNVIVAKRNAMRLLRAKMPQSSSNDRNNLIFHTLSYLSRCRFGSLGEAASGWKAFNPSEEEIEDAIAVVRTEFSKTDGTDKAAKSRVFNDAVRLTADNKRGEAGS